MELSKKIKQTRLRNESEGYYVLHDPDLEQMEELEQRTKDLQEEVENLATALQAEAKRADDLFLENQSLKELLDQWHKEFDLFKENQRLKEQVEELTNINKALEKFKPPAN